VCIWKKAASKSDYCSKIRRQNIIAPETFNGLLLPADKKRRTEHPKSSLVERRGAGATRHILCAGKQIAKPLPYKSGKRVLLRPDGARRLAVLCQTAMLSGVSHTL
jgi:hypothetical protein